MRIAVTGATGFIGSRLALAAAQSGREVRAFGLERRDDELRAGAELRAAGIRPEPVDLRAREPWAGLLEGVDAVFHLGAAQHEAGAPDRLFEEVNVAGTVRLLDAAIRQGVKRFVHASTIGVHGELKGVLTLDSPTKPDNVYGRTKLAGEQAVRARTMGAAPGDEPEPLPEGAEPPIEGVIVRVPETYGPGDPRLLKLFKGVAKGRFPVIGKGLNRHQPIHVDDLVRALLLMAEHGSAPRRTFLLGGPEPVTTNAMLESVAAALGAQPPKLRVPMKPLLAAALATETLLKPLGKEPPLHRRRLGFFTKDQATDRSYAKATLGFEPEIGFARGAAGTAAWYKEHGLL